MERQKIFWVVLSVSVFVVVVLVVGAFLLRPRPAASREAPVTVSPLTDQGTQVYEYQMPAGTPGASGTTGAAGTGAAGSQTGAAGASGTTGTPGSTETLRFYIGEGGDAGSKPPASTASPPAPSVSPGQTSATPAPAAPAPGTASQVAVAPRATPAPRVAPAAPAASAAPAVKPPARTVQYWIQTGSYRSQSKAEDLARLLDDKGLAGRVFSFDVRGATWYRVRVGPYTSSGEADKFLAEVKKLQGLETSYVSQVGPARPPLIN